MKLISIQKHINDDLDHYSFSVYCVIETDLDENKSLIVFSGKSLSECHAFVSLREFFTDKFSEKEMERMFRYGETINH